MLVNDIIDFLNSYAPLDYAEDFDNTGLIVGNKNDKVYGIIICCLLYTSDAADE